MSKIDYTRTTNEPNKKTRTNFRVYGFLAFVILGGWVIWLFQFQIGIAFLVLVALSGAAGCINLRFMYLERKERHRRVKLENDIYEYNAKIKLIPQGNGVLLHPDLSRPEREPKHIPAQLTARAGQQVIEAQATEAGPLHFDDIIHRLNTAMIVGGQDSGKSTLLQWIAHRRNGQTIALDPHHGQWPVDLRVGRGRDYTSIEAMLARVYRTMDSRYKSGTSSPAINVIIDEWMSIVDNCPNAAGYIKTLLTEGRKAGVFMFVGSHTDRARPIGLDGAADLKEGMALVYLKWQPRTNERSAEIVFNRDRYELITPGPFNVAMATPEVWVAREQANTIKRCVVCSELLSGKQEKYCSDKCRYDYHNSKAQP